MFVDLIILQGSFKIKDNYLNRKVFILCITKVYSKACRLKQ